MKRIASMIIRGHVNREYLGNFSKTTGFRFTFIIFKENIPLSAGGTEVAKSATEFIVDKYNPSLVLFEKELSTYDFLKGPLLWSIFCCLQNSQA